MGVNVKEFGAKGDGKTNDTTAIREAIAALPGEKGTVFFPAGVYLVTLEAAKATFHLKDGMVFRGDGRTATTIKVAEKPSTGTIVSAESGRVEFREMTLEGPTVYRAPVEHENVDDPRGIQAANADGVQVYCQDVRFKRLTTGYLGWDSKVQIGEFEACEFDGDNIGLATGTEKQVYVMGILTDQAGPVICRGCRFINNGSNADATTQGHSHDIYVSDDTALMVSECRFENHIYGHAIQSNGPAEAPPASNVPYFHVKDSYFGKPQVEGGSGQGESVRTGKKHRALIEGCEFQAKRGAIYALGDILASDCLFAGGDSIEQNYITILFQTVAGDVNSQPTNKRLAVRDCVFEGKVTNEIYVAVTGTVLDVDGCEFRGSGSNGIKWEKSGATELIGRVRDCYFGPNYASFLMYQAEGNFKLLTVTGSEFENAAFGIQNSTGQTITTLILCDNYFHDQSVAVRKQGTVTTETSLDNIGYTDVSAATVASAEAVTLPAGRLVTVTGTTGIKSIVATSKGDERTLLFTGVLTVTDGSNLKLQSNFEATADDTLALICDGTNWYQTGRSMN